MGAGRREFRGDSRLKAGTWADVRRAATGGEGW
jgi:hypothetical protein